MPQFKCNSCGKIVNGPHYCTIENRTIERDDSSFITSLLVAEMTGSSLMGYVVGGDLVGSMIGSELSSDSGSSCDTSSSDNSSCNTGSSSDF